MSKARLESSNEVRLSEIMQKHFIISYKCFEAILLILTYLSVSQLVRRLLTQNKAQRL